jgi:hypothetical protein
LDLKDLDLNNLEEAHPIRSINRFKGGGGLLYARKESVNLELALSLQDKVALLSLRL